MHCVLPRLLWPSSRLQVYYVLDLTPSPREEGGANYSFPLSKSFESQSQNRRRPVFKPRAIWTNRQMSLNRCYEHGLHCSLWLFQVQSVSRHGSNSNSSDSTISMNRRV